MPRSFERSCDAHLDRAAGLHYAEYDELDDLNEFTGEVIEEALRNRQADDVVAGLQSVELADAERMCAVYDDDKALAALVRELVKKSITDSASEKARKQFAEHH
ncbi:hypothetical protein [Burkholderia vietnamiensis]|uniref:hypothetical protein n=1 Tax=Burkholderia vietnamiensis TaxID=60552 RepID=UPI001CF45366|nr:hypothetical protein [Burkholderia vietnamiensis]MCA7945587.1 hypothetical protein [Burkholderia vietnamiensis]